MVSIRKIFLVVLLAAACGLPVRAQGVLPASFGGWAAVGAVSQAPANQLEQFASDKAGVLREYGIHSAERREYAQGAGSATVTLYNFVDPSAAYGGFTFLREAPMARLEMGNVSRYAAGSHERALIVIGNFLLDVSSVKTRPADGDLKALASSAVPKADRRPFPTIGEFLPQTGLIQGSELYILGPQALARAFPAGQAGATDWIGFDKSAEAIVARYHLAGEPKDQEALLMLAEYPTQQVAADKYSSLGNSLALNRDPREANGRPIVFGTRSSALIALLANVDSRDSATALLTQIHYGSDVTWNEPTHELTDPSISTIVVGAILDTGSIMMLAFAAGLGFGGFRLLVKLVAPGKVFDRNEDVEILQLGLSSKPVKANN